MPTQTLTESARSAAVTLRVVPRDQHPISRKDISPNALRVLYRLREGGHRAFLVGGAVRDLLVGGHPTDFDIATSATPEAVTHLLRPCRLLGPRLPLPPLVSGRETPALARTSPPPNSSPYPAPRLPSPPRPNPTPPPPPPPPP